MTAKIDAIVSGWDHTNFIWWITVSSDKTIAVDWQDGEQESFDKNTKEVPVPKIDGGYSYPASILDEVLGVGTELIEMSDADRLRRLADYMDEHG